METRKRRGFPQDLGKASMRNSRLYHTFHKRRRRRPQPNAALTGTGFGTAVFFHEKLPTTNREDRAKEGWTRHPVNGPVPLTGADGVVRSTSNHRCLNEPPRSCELIVIRRYSPPCTTARRGGCVIKENLAKPPKQTQPGWFSFWIHRKTTPASR